eukprot:165432_1
MLRFGSAERKERSQKQEVMLLGAILREKYEKIRGAFTKYAVSSCTDDSYLMTFPEMFLFARDCGLVDSEHSAIHFESIVRIVKEKSKPQTEGEDDLEEMAISPMLTPADFIRIIIQYAPERYPQVISLSKCAQRLLREHIFPQCDPESTVVTHSVIFESEMRSAPVMTVLQSRVTELTRVFEAYAERETEPNKKSDSAVTISWKRLLDWCRESQFFIKSSLSKLDLTTAVCAVMHARGVTVPELRAPVSDIVAKGARGSVGSDKR